MYRLVWLTLLLYTAALLDATRKGCSLDNKDCLLKSARTKLVPFSAGNSSIVLESSDPIFKPIIIQKQPNLECVMKNVYMRGFSRCSLEYVDINERKQFYVGFFHCPCMTIEADCSINGLLGDMYLNGEGKCIMDHYDFQLRVYSDLNLYSGRDGLPYMRYEKHLLNMDVHDGIQYQFKDFYNGTEDLSSTVTSYANENWKLIFKTLNVHVFKPLIEKVVENANVYFSFTPLFEVFFEE